MVDPQVRLQNISLEMQQLLAERNMAWTESTNRSAMLMAVVGAAVLALVLVGNATNYDQSFLLFTLLVLPVVLLTGFSTIGRIGELDTQDWRLVGLNRLRHARLELDPDFAKYLIGSQYDDVRAVLESYASPGVSSAAHGFYVLTTLIAFLNGMIAAFLAADIVLTLGFSGLAATVVGVISFFAVLIGLALTGYRQYITVRDRWTPRFPTPTESPDGG